MSNFLSDIAALAKSGYSVADIKELLSLSTSSSTSSDNAASDSPQSEVATSKDKTEEIAKNENQEIDKNDSSSSDSTEEYKSKIADLESKITDLTDKLSKAQKDNVRSDMADADKQKDAATILSEMAQSYM